jgi:hypothetical protein
VAGNKGYLATHTKQAVRARAHLPVRLEIETGKGIALVTGYPAVPAERLEGTSGTMQGEWLVTAEPGSTVTVSVISDNAGRDRKTFTVKKGA